jgi:hypothetical protein
MGAGALGSGITTGASGLGLNAGAFDIGAGLGAGLSALDTGVGLGTGLGLGALDTAASPKVLSTGDKIIGGLDIANKAIPLATILGAALGSDQQVPTTTPLTKDAAQELRDTTPLEKWDWNRIKSEAATAGMDPNSFVARNWDKMSAGQYNMAGGGLTRLAQGAGTGRADTIDSRLSDGEYVMDAETVALLGDGSTKAGASVLDKLRESIRRHKGRALAAGKISPDAKSPLAYLGEI